MKVLALVFVLQFAWIRNSTTITGTAQLFAEGTISTQDDEAGGTLSPDGKFFFYVKKSPSTGRNNVSIICYSVFEDKKWSKPAVAPFSGIWRDLNPHFSPDGSSLFFISDRPVANDNKRNADIWMVKRINETWSDPIHIDTVINSNYIEQSCSMTKDGTLYFSSSRDEKSFKIYRSTSTNGIFNPPQPLDSVINSDYQQTDICVAPDESYILFTSIGREDAVLPKSGTAYPRTDLYISYRKNGQWTKPKILPGPFNSEADDSNSFITADGSTLFFTSKRSFATQPMKTKLNYPEFEQQLHSTLNGFGNIYTIETAALKQ